MDKEELANKMAKGAMNALTQEEYDALQEYGRANWSTCPDSLVLMHMRNMLGLKDD